MWSDGGFNIYPKRVYMPGERYVGGGCYIRGIGAYGFFNERIDTRRLVVGAIPKSLDDVIALHLNDTGSSPADSIIWAFRLQAEVIRLVEDQAHWLSWWNQMASSPKRASWDGKTNVFDDSIVIDFNWTFNESLDFVRSFHT
jgi:hypothetical protein